MNMVRREYLELDQSKIDRAMRLLGTTTEQETIERALDLVLADEPALRAHKRVKKVGGVEDLFR